MVLMVIVVIALGPAEDHHLSAGNVDGLLQLHLVLQQAELDAGAETVEGEQAAGQRHLGEAGDQATGEERVTLVLLPLGGQVDVADGAGAGGVHDVEELLKRLHELLRHAVDEGVVLGGLAQVLHCRGDR